MQSQRNQHHHIPLINNRVIQLHHKSHQKHNSKQSHLLTKQLFQHLQPSHHYNTNEDTDCSKTIQSTEFSRFDKDQWEETKGQREYDYPSKHNN